MIDKEVKKTVDLIIDKVGEEKFIKMQEMVFKLGILIAVRDTNNSTDFDELAQSIYESKEKCIDIPAIKNIIEKYYPILITEHLITKDGCLSSEGLAIANDYEWLLIW